MAALAAGLDRWLPSQMYRALNASASLTEVAEAAGRSPAEVADRWETWATGQTRQLVDGRPLLDPAEAATVRTYLTSALTAGAAGGHGDV